MNKTTLLTLLAFALLAIVSARAEDKAPAAPAAEAKAITPAADGSVLLHSRDVTIHGKNVRYEPQPHKNTIGYWTKVEDWVSWDFEITKPGTFSVEILQGCGKGSGGSEVEISAGDQVLKFTVKETGGFQDFLSRDIGQFTFTKPGRYTLTVKPKTKPGGAVMDLRQVMLRPATPDAGGKNTSKDKP